MTTDERLQEKMSKLAGQLLALTQNYRISWTETDKENEFLYATIKNSISIARVSRMLSVVYIITVYNSRGTAVDSLETGSVRKDQFMMPAPWNKVLSDLHEAARKSALNVEEELDILIAALEGEEGPVPPTG